MSNRRRAVLVLAAALAALCADAARASAQATFPGAIRGQVVDASTGLGIARVALDLSGGGAGDTETTSTEADGGFVFEALTPGHYSIRASHAAYLSAAYPASQLGRRSNVLMVAAGQTVERVVIRLQRAGAITGRVVDQFGDVVPRARVWLRVFPGGVANDGEMTVSGTNTNDIGEFRLAPLAPGAYLLAASTASEGAVAWQRPPLPPAGFVAHPNAAGLDQASPVLVRAGEAVSGLELKLYPRTRTRVRGVVLAADGKPADGAVLTVGEMLSVDAMTTGGAGAALVNGAFDMLLMPGVYEFSAHSRDTATAAGSPGAGRSPRATVVQRVTVSDDAIADLRLQLHDPKVVRGRLVFDGATRPPPAASQVRLFAAYAGNHSECGMRERSVSDDLTFSIELVGVRCFLGAGVTGWSTRSIQRGGRHILFEGLAVQEPGAIEDVVITLSDRTTRLFVEVGDGKGPVDEFVVVAFPADRARRPGSGSGIPGQQSRLFRAAGPLPAGNARIEGLLAGDYYVVALDPNDGERSRRPDAEWLDRLTPLAQRVTLAEGEVRALSLTIVDLPDSP